MRSVGLVRPSWRRCGIVVSIGALTVWAMVDLSDHLVERQLLASEAADVSRSASDTHEIAEAIIKRVQTRVSRGDRHVPFLRSTALESWVTGEGSCGEAARVIVLMLRSVGVDSGRVYLRAEADGYFHVAITYRVGRSWYLADTVNATEPFQRFVAMNQRRAVDQFGLPNSQFYSYSFVNWGRLPPFFEIDQRTPPPPLAVLLMESPSLLLASMKLGAVGVGAVLWLAWCGRSGRRESARSGRPAGYHSHGTREDSYRRAVWEAAPELGALNSAPSVQP